MYRILAIGLICLFANASEISAAENMARVIQNGILKNNLAVRIRAGSVFNDKIIRFLDRGFTIRIEYNIELWQSRGFWFDRLEKQKEFSYQVDFDALEQKYVCQRTNQNSSIIAKTEKELEKIIEWVTYPDFPIMFTPIAQLESDSEYYYNINILVATLTAENVKDLQKWMGEFEEKESSSLAKTAFKIISDFISSRNHKQYSVRTDKFSPSELPKLAK